jgi:hypothetical protein
MKQTAVVVGLGEVGRPLLELVERAGHTAVGVDIEPASIRRGCRGGPITRPCAPFPVLSGKGTTLSESPSEALTKAPPETPAARNH